MATCFRFLPRESHGQRSLAGYSPWGCKESDMTECVHGHTHTHTHTHKCQRQEVSLGWRLERTDLSPRILCRVVLGLPTPQWHLGGPTVDVSSCMKDLFTLLHLLRASKLFGVLWRENQKQGSNRTVTYPKGQADDNVSSEGPAHHWRSICVWINKGRDRWNCWGGRFQLAAQDHFLLAETVKLWLWPGSLIWRPSAFLDSPLAGVVEWAHVRMRGSFQWPPGCW